MVREEQVFNNYLRSKNLKNTSQRRMVLNVFLKTEKHLTADELYRIVKKKNPSVGLVTIYRTLKLLSECGLCRELKFQDGVVRYEHEYNHPHHDHMICIKCEKCVEIIDPKIEELQKSLSKKYGFVQKYHRMEIYGLCKKCK